MANKHLSYIEFKALFGDIGLTEWVKYNWLNNYYPDLHKDGYTMPKEYQRLDYLRAFDGGFIDTQYKVNSHDELNAVYTHKRQIYYYDKLFGSQNRATYSQYFFFGFRGALATSPLKYSVGYGNAEVFSLIDWDLDKKHYINFKEGALYLDNTLIAESPEVTEWDSDFNLYIFAMNRNNTAIEYSESAIHSFIIKSKIYLIPARRKSDNVIGFYDLIRKEFYSGEQSLFEAGEEI